MSTADVNENKIPDWVYEQAAARKAAGFKMKGLITITPNGVDPEVYMAENGFA